MAKRATGRKTTRAKKPARKRTRAKQPLVNLKRLFAFLALTGLLAVSMIAAGYVIFFRTVIT